MLNKVFIMGRLARDPELRRTQAGTAVASFTLAVDWDYKAASGDRETDWIDCVAWRKTADFVSRYFNKGRMAVVEGRLQIRDWTDDKGNKRRNTEVLVENIYFGDSKNTKPGEPATERSPNVAPPPRQEYTDMSDDQEGLPF